jgi:hypothetical protein
MTASELSDLDPVAAWAMHATVDMQAWPATGPGLFSFYFSPPPGNTSWASPSRCTWHGPNPFPPNLDRLKF